MIMNLKKSIRFCFSILMLNLITLKAQELADRPLTISDRVPDFAFPAINYSTDTFRISDAKGKLLLLEFWARSCGACIMQFPKLNRLQRHFGDKLLVMPLGITTRSSNSANFFVENLMNNPRVDLPTAIVNRPDTVFESYFEYTGLPHVVWIKDQRIIAITDHTAVNESNIAKAISDCSFKIRPKPVQRFLSKEEIFLISIPTVGERSAVHPYIDTLYSSGVVPTVFVSGTSRVFRAINMSVPALYTSIYRNVRDNGLGNNPGNLFSHKFREIGEYVPYLDVYAMPTDPSNEQMERFSNEHLFCYEFAAPKDLPIDEFYSRMIKDLDEKFGVTSHVEKRFVRYGIVTLLPDYYTWEPNNEDERNPVGYFQRLGHVTSLSALAGRLDLSVHFAEPIDFSGTNVKFDYPIRLEIDDTRSRAQILKDLEKRGIKLLHCERLAEVLVLN